MTRSLLLEVQRLAGERCDYCRMFHAKLESLTCLAAVSRRSRSVFLGGPSSPILLF
jgi:hypothetical protein